MTLAPRQSQRQQQTLGFRQLQAISILRLDNTALTGFLLRRAEANPLLRVTHGSGSLPDAAPPELADRASGLHEHVLPQLSLILSSDSDRALGQAFLEALAPTGWLDAPLTQIAAEADQPVSRAAEVLGVLQAGIDPVGLFARDLRECLRLQATERGQLDDAMAQVLDHLPRLGSAGPAAVAVDCGLEPEHVERCLARIRRMDPRPGLAFGSDHAPLREPDVTVEQRAGEWHVELNHGTLPSVALSGDPGTTGGAGLRAARTEALWLAGIVARRNSTVLAVARAVFVRQKGFLDHGPAALVALSRTEIARTLDLHDSTVGRVANGLLVQTPHGMRTLGSMFGGTTHVALAQHADGAAPASAAIRQRLAELIAAEDQHSPQSDDMLASALAREGKPVSRRTIARFREQLGIPGRTFRRRSAKADDSGGGQGARGQQAPCIGARPSVGFGDKIGKDA